MIQTKFSIRINQLFQFLIYYDWKIGPDPFTRTESGRFLTDLNKTRLKPFFGLNWMSSRGLVRTQISKCIGISLQLIGNEFQSENFTNALEQLCFSGLEIIPNKILFWGDKSFFKNSSKIS